MDAQQEGAVYKPGGGASLEVSFAGALISDAQTPRMGANQFLLLQLPGLEDGI